MGIIVKNVKKEIGQEVLFENLNVIFPETGMIHIKGSSGCGKTAFMHILCGIDQDYTGEVTFNKQNIQTISDYKQYCISLMPQVNQLLAYQTVYDACMHMTKIKGLICDQDKLHVLLDELGLMDYKNVKIRELSGGMKQRVCFIQTVLTDCPVMFFDEPASHLDEGYKCKLYRLLKGLSRSHLIVVISHDENMSEYTDKCIDFHQLEDQYIFSYQPYIRYNKRKLEKTYSQLKNMVQLIIHERRKVFIAFMTQIYMVLAIALIVSGIDSFKMYYLKQYQNSINYDLVMIKRKDKKALTFDQLSELHAVHPLYVELGSIRGINYITSAPINKELKEGHIVVNEAFYKKVKKKSVEYALGELKQKLIIDDVVKDDSTSPVLYYQPQSFVQAIKQDITNYTVCYVYEKDVEAYLKQLDHDYQGYCDAYEYYQTYLKMVHLFEVGAIVFMIVSAIIGIILFGHIIVAFIIDNRHVLTLYLSSGYSVQNMVHFFAKTLLMIILSIGVCSVAVTILFMKCIQKYNFLERFLQKDMVFVLPGTNLYMIFILAYMLLSCVLTFLAYIVIRKQNLAQLIRGDQQC